MKITQALQKLGKLPFWKKNFHSTFGKGNLAHLTTNVMSSGQRFAILAMFLCGEVAWYFSGCIIFLTHSLTHSGFMIYFFLEVAWFVVERLRELFCGELARFFVWRSYKQNWRRGCVILYVESFSNFVCGEVAWFLCFCLWRLRDFFLKRLLGFYVQRLLAFLVKRLNDFFWCRLAW